MTSSGRILERVTYSAYGVATRHPAADFNRDGFVDFFDDADFDDCYVGNGCPAGQTADLDLDGFVDLFDYDHWDLNFAEQASTSRGVLSQSSGSAAVNRIGYAGYWFEPSTQQYLVRHREYDPNVGAWDERDPMGYVDGSDLYMYVQNRPIAQVDSSGTQSQFCIDRSGECDAGTDISPHRYPLFSPHWNYSPGPGATIIVQQSTGTPFRWSDCQTFAPPTPCANGYELIPGTPPPTTNGCGSAWWQTAPAVPLCDSLMLPMFATESRCCTVHDICYSICGADKALCDSMFFSCLSDMCNTFYSGWIWRIKRAHCNWCANQFYRIVRDLGYTPFCKAQSSRCRCRP